MPKMTLTQKTSIEDALTSYRSETPSAGAGYTLMRAARKGLLEIDTDVVPPSQFRGEELLLAVILDLPDVGPLPEFYPFLRNAKAGFYRVATGAVISDRVAEAA